MIIKNQKEKRRDKDGNGIRSFAPSLLGKKG
jgi:hypothetical protein